MANNYEMGIPWYTNVVNLNYTVKDKFSNKTIQFEDNNVSLSHVTDRSFATSKSEDYYIAGGLDSNDYNGFHTGKTNKIIIKRNKNINGNDYTFPIKLYKECYPDELIDRMDDESNNILDLHTYAFSYIKLKHRYRGSGDIEQNYNYTNVSDKFLIYSDDPDDLDEETRKKPINNLYKFKYQYTNPVNTVGIKTADFETNKNAKSYENIYIFPQIYDTESTYFVHKDLLSAYYYRFVNNFETYSFTGPGTDSQNNLGDESTLLNIPVIYGYEYSSLGLYKFKYTFEQRNEWSTDETAYTNIYDFTSKSFTSYMPSVILNSWYIDSAMTASQSEADSGWNDTLTCGPNVLSGTNFTSGNGYINLVLPNKQTFTENSRVCISYTLGKNIDAGKNAYLLNNLIIFYNPLLEVSKLQFTSFPSYNITFNYKSYDYKYFDTSVMGNPYTTTLFAAIKYDPNRIENDINITASSPRSTSEVDGNILFDTKFNVSSEQSYEIKYSLINDPENQVWETNTSGQISFYNQDKCIFGSYLYDDTTKEKSLVSYSYISYEISSANIMSYYTDGITYIYKPEVENFVGCAFNSKTHNEIWFDKYNYINKAFTHNNGAAVDTLYYYEPLKTGTIDKHIVGSVFNIFNYGSASDYYSYVYGNPPATDINLNYGTVPDIYNNAVWNYISSKMKTNIVFLDQVYNEDLNGVQHYILEDVKTLFNGNTLATLSSKDPANPTLYKFTASEYNDINIRNKVTQYIDYIFTKPEEGDHPYDYHTDQYEVDERLVNEYYNMYLKLEDYFNTDGRWVNDSSANIGTSLQADITNGGDSYKKFNVQNWVGNASTVDNEVKEYWRKYIKPYEYEKLSYDDASKIEDLVGDGKYINYTSKEYLIYNFNEETEREDGYYEWFNNLRTPISNHSLASYIYSVTQIGNYETSKQELYIKEFTLGGTYSYAYTYLSSKYSDDNIHKLSYISGIEGTSIVPLITDDICIAEYDNSPEIQHITDMITWKPLSEQKPCVDVDEDNIALSDEQQDMVVTNIATELKFYDNYVYNSYLNFINTFNTQERFGDFADFVTYYRNNVDDTDTPTYIYNDNTLFTNDNISDYYKYSVFNSTYTYLNGQLLTIDLGIDDYGNTANGKITKYYSLIPKLEQLFTYLKYTQYTHDYVIKIDGTIVTPVGSENVTGGSSGNLTWVRKELLKNTTASSGNLGNNSHDPWVRTGTSPDYVWTNQATGDPLDGNTEYNYVQEVSGGSSGTVTFGDKDVKYNYSGASVETRKWIEKEIDAKGNYTAFINLLKTFINPLRTDNKIYYSSYANNENSYPGISQIIGDVADKIEYVTFGSTTYGVEVKPYSYIAIDQNAISLFNEIIGIEPRAFNSNFYTISGDENIAEAETLYTYFLNNSSERPNGINHYADYNEVNDYHNYILGMIWNSRNIIKKYLDKIANYNTKLINYSNEVDMKIKTLLDQLESKGESTVTDNYISSFDFLNITSQDDIRMITTLPVAKKFLEMFKEVNIKGQIRRHLQRAIKYLIFIAGGGDPTLSEFRQMYEKKYNADLLKTELKEFQDIVIKFIVNLDKYSYNEINDSNKFLYELVMNNTSFNYILIYQLISILNEAKLSVKCNYYNNFNLYYLVDNSNSFVDMYSKIYNLENNFNIGESAEDFEAIKSCFKYKYYISDGNVRMDETFNVYKLNDLKDFNNSIYIEYGELNNYNDPRLHILLYYNDSFVYEVPLQNDMIYKPHQIGLPPYTIERIGNDIKITFTEEPELNIENVNNYIYDLNFNVEILNGVSLSPIQNDDNNIIKSFIIPGNYEEENIINSFYIFKYFVIIHNDSTGDDQYYNCSRENAIVYYFSNDDSYKYERIDFGSQAEANDIISKYADKQEKIISMHIYAETNSEDLGDNPLYWILTSTKNDVSQFKLIEEVYYEQ